jgi:hypothetical protein
MFILEILFAIANGFRYVLEKCGLKLAKMNLTTVLKGLPPEAVEESKCKSIAKPLELFLDGLDKSRNLPLLSRIINIEIVKSLLQTRASVKQAILRNPSIIKTPIKSPVFIIGLPRTGTTLLHQLFCTDPQFRAPMYWELMYPCPPARPKNWSQCDRFKRAVKDFNMLRYFIPRDKHDVVHKTGAQYPEECYHILSRCFVQYHTFLRVESLDDFTDWLYNLDMTDFEEIYQYYKTELQVIGYGGLDKQTYVLKANVHLLCLDAILKVFPDAKFVFTCRNLSEMVGSFCSLQEVVTTPYGPMHDEFGARCVRLLSEFANRAVAVMKQYDHVPQEQNPFYFVDYETLTKNPISAMQDVYSHCNRRLTAKTELAMKRHIHANPKNKHGKHQYSMANYNISDQDLLDNFKPFIDYFKGRYPNLI